MTLLTPTDSCLGSSWVNHIVGFRLYVGVVRYSGAHFFLFEKKLKNYIIKYIYFQDYIMNKINLLNELDSLLKANLYKDSSKNGLQVDSTKQDIKKIWYAVDANSYIFDMAIAENVDLLIVHHWIFWWDDEPIVWVNYNRISKLIKNDIALYASHIPLDAHPVVWNNYWLINNIIKDFNIKNYTKQEFCMYEWNYIGAGLRFEEWIDVIRFVDSLVTNYGFEDNFYNFWNIESITSISVVSWVGWDDVRFAKDWNYDVFVTGECSHENLIIAKELNQSIVVWWHRETETIWISLLANYIEKEFWIQTVFLDKKY